MFLLADCVTEGVIVWLTRLPLTDRLGDWLCDCLAGGTNDRTTDRTTDGVCGLRHAPRFPVVASEYCLNIPWIFPEYS